MKPLIPIASSCPRSHAGFSLAIIGALLVFLPWLSLTLLHSNSQAADDERLKAIRRAGQQALAPASSQRRVALVIGNAAYKVGPLRNPANDAEDIAQTLRDIGFTVYIKTNADQREMEEAVDDFARKIQDGDIALFYFSGHGVQVRGDNFLIPIGASITTESDVRFKAVNVGYILSKLEESRNRTNIVILDACRNNPFRSFRSFSRGLNAIDAPRGTFIAYATAPGTVADDGEGRNSPYTEHLIQALKAKDISIYDVFGQVLLAVEKDTAGRQIPWISSSVPSFIINPSGVPKPASEPPVSPSPIPKPGRAVATLLLTTVPPGSTVKIGARDVGRSGDTGLLIVKDVDVGISLDIRVEKEGHNEARVTLIIPSSYEGQAYTYGEIRLEPSPDEPFRAFRLQFPNLGKPEYDLAKERLFPDWKKNVAPAGGWNEFLAEYKKFIRWWTDQGSPGAPGLDQWKRRLASSTPVSPPAETPERPPAVIEKLSREYHEHFVASDKDEMMDYYNFPLKFYERGYQDRSFVDGEWTRYFGRWIDRNSEILSLDRTRGSLASGEVTVRLTYSYNWTNLYGQAVTGTASCFITWKKSGDEWKIVELDEKRGTEAKSQEKTEPTKGRWRRAVVRDADGFACLREGKGTDTECFEQVPDGEEVQVQVSDEEWRRVKRANGQEGFMHVSRLKFLPEKTVDGGRPQPYDDPGAGPPKNFPESVMETRWYVVAGSHLSLEQAAAQARKLNAASSGFRAQVYAPQEDNSHYAVVIGEDLTHEAARELKRKALEAGLPKDTFLKAVR